MAQFYFFALNPGGFFFEFIFGTLCNRFFTLAIELRRKHSLD
jgi:hypothetical protein